jgi:hypothetical protein
MEDGGIKEETSSNRAERKREGAAEKLVEVSTCIYPCSNEGPTEECALIVPPLFSSIRYQRNVTNCKNSNSNMPVLKLI